MYEKSENKTANILVTRDGSNKRVVAKSDWQSFFCTMCRFYGVRLDWFGFGSIPEKDLRIAVVSALV